MPSVITELTPTLTCVCGEKRVFPVERIGMPPIGTESFCVGCSRVWRLVSIDRGTLTNARSWVWVDFPDERDTDIKAANALARTLLGIDAALSELAGPAKMTVAAETHDGFVSKLLGIDGDLALGLAMLNVGRAMGNA